MFDTTITVTIQEILIWLLLIVAIIAVIYLIVMFSRIIKITKPLEETVNKANAVLDDVKVITENAKDGTEDAKRAMHAAAHTMHDVAHILDVNRGPIAAVTGLLGAGASIAGISKRTTKRRKDK